MNRPLNGFIGAIDPQGGLSANPPRIRGTQAKAGKPLRGGWPTNRGAKQTLQFRLDRESNFGIQTKSGSVGDPRLLPKNKKD